MEIQTPNIAVGNCERALRKYRDNCIEKNIYKSCIPIADRLLDRRDELVELYKEVDAHLKSAPMALYMFFDSVLLSAIIWNPEENKKARLDKSELETINRQIADTAEHLADLLDQRSHLQNTTGFSCNTHYGVCETLDAAASSNYSYNSWVKDSFRQLFHRFDLKYWPSTSEFLLELAQDADEAEVYPSDEITAAATTGSRASLKDYIRALERHVQLNDAPGLGHLSSIFQLSDSSIASLINCVLDIAPEELKDASYIKRFRQGEREREKSRQEAVS